MSRTERRPGIVLDRTRARAAAGAVLATVLLGGCAGDVRSAVLGTEQTAQVSVQCSRPDLPRYTATWKPEAKIIQQLELDLPALTQLAPATGPSRAGDAYVHQYFGVVVAGKRLIYVNAFQEGLANKDWSDYAIVICEGGHAAWGALYDPADHSFSGFAFNGPPE
jgi:hypothetical protein